MTTYLSRADWGARPRAGYTTFPADRPLGVACHWPGTTTQFRSASAAAVASALRGWQNYHMDVRGWSDIAYGVGIDWAGRVWELRGINVRTAANGSTQSNADYTAALWILGIGEQPTDAQVQAFRDWRSSHLLAAHHQAAAVKTHNDVRLSPTECPGPAVTALVRSGTLLRPGGTDTGKDYFDMATEAELRNAIKTEMTALTPALAQQIANATSGPRIASVRQGDSNAQYLIGPGLFVLIRNTAQLAALRKAGICKPAPEVVVSDVEMAELREYAERSRVAAVADLTAKLDQLLGRPTADVDETALAAALAPLLQDTTPEEAELIAAKFRDAITGGQVVLTIDVAGTPPAADKG